MRGRVFKSGSSSCNPTHVVKEELIVARHFVEVKCCKLERKENLLMIRIAINQVSALAGSHDRLRYASVR
jgi:hypothetical protein